MKLRVLLVSKGNSKFPISYIFLEERLSTTLLAYLEYWATTLRYGSVLGIRYACLDFELATGACFTFAMPPDFSIILS
jgi:hypothetical protein